MDKDIEALKVPAIVRLAAAALAMGGVLLLLLGLQGQLESSTTTWVGSDWRIPVLRFAPTVILSLGASVVFAATKLYRAKAFALVLTATLIAFICATAWGALLLSVQAISLYGIITPMWLLGAIGLVFAAGASAGKIERARARLSAEGMDVGF